MKILVIEDDSKIANFLKAGFGEENHVVDVAEDGEKGLNLAESHSYDLIVLDLMLPKKDGMSVLNTLKLHKNPSSVLILSAKHSTEEKVMGLEAGADDYLAKPFSFSELLARSNALVRRQQGKTISHALTFCDLSLDRLSRQVHRAGKKIELQGKEFALLELFLKNPGRVLSKTYILDQIWNIDFDPQTNVVDVLVCRLRNRIEKNFPKKLIFTIRGAGYVLKEDS